MNNQPYPQITTTDLANLNHRWTAEVTLHNGHQITIWHTALPSCKSSILSVESVASDLPKSEIKNTPLIAVRFHYCAEII